MARFDPEVEQSLSEENQGAARDNITEADTSADWRLAQKVRNFERRAVEPRSIPDYFPPAPAEPLFKPGRRGIFEFNPAVLDDVDLSPYAEIGNHLLQEEAQRIETEFYGLRGQQQLEYVASLDPNDLALVDNDDIDRLRAAEQYIRFRDEGQERQQTELDNAVERKLRNRERLATGLGSILGFMTGGDLSVETPEPTEEDLEAIRAEVQAEIEDPSEPGFVGSVFGALGTAITAVTDTIGLGVDLASGTWVQQRDYMLEQEEAIRSDEVRLSTLRREASAEDLNQVWQSLASDEPDLHNQYLQMAGFDPTLAFGLFSADIEDMPEAQDQIAQMEDEISDTLVQFMREEDYGTSKAIMDALGAWDRFIPMRLATASTLLFTDEDFQQALGSGEWARMNQLIEESDYSPAEALGLGGTALGMMLDFGAGIAFDPTTWIFGPKRAGGTQLNSVEGVGRVAKGPLVKANIDDITRLLAKGDGAAALANARWLEDVGLADELLDLGRGAVDAAGDVIGPGISPEQSSRLRELQTTRVQASKGAEAGAESTVRQTFEGYGDRLRLDNPNRLAPLSGPNPAVKPKPITVEGVDYTARRITETLDNGTDAYGVVWASAEGELLGGVRYTTGGTAEWYTAPGFRSADVQLVSRSLDAIHNSQALGPGKAADLLINSAADSSITKAGAKALNREIDRFIDEVAGGVDLAAIKNIDRAAVEDLVTRAMEMGAMPPSANRLAVGVSMANRFRDLAAKGASIGEMKRFFSPHRTVTNFQLRGPGSFNRVLQAVEEIWGPNRAKANEHVEKLWNLKRAKTQAKKRMLADPRYKRRMVLTEEIAKLKEANFGNVVGDELDELVGEGASQGLSDRMLRLQEEADTLRQELMDSYRDVNDYNDVHQAMQEVWDDYNREVIAKNKAWADVVDPETGMVPWDKLRLGSNKTKALVNDMEGTRQFFDEQTVKHLPEVEAQMQMLSGTLGTRMSTSVPLSPLDMIAAGSASGSTYRKIVANRYGNMAREGFWQTQRIWVLDKVMRPSTAMVVSFDELQRAFHVYGYDGINKYLLDKADRLSARASALAQRKGIRVSAGSKALPESVQKRLKAQQEYAVQYRQAERQMLEGMGVGWDDIDPGQPGYMDAARRWSGNFLQDAGFRKFLEGEDAFKAWWDSPSADRVRANAGPNVTAVEAYQGWNSIWDHVSRVARSEGIEADWTKAWRDTAREIDGASGMHRELPDFVFETMGTVRGTRKVAPGRFSLVDMQDAFFDKFFLEPTNYRRGFINKLAQEYEVKRLEMLNTSRGRKVLTDDELAVELGMPGKGAELRLHYGSYLDEVAEQRGYATRGRIQQLAEQRAIDEIDNMMYSWDSASRAGKMSKGLFPFGGPWADMAGFWGREMLTRPHLRGYINKSNFFGMNNIINGAVTRMPVNPRTVSFISRMANTDTEITEGWVGEGGGLIPGSEGSDLSPLSFLPTKGDQAMGVLLPGIGYIPTFAADIAITNYLADPKTDPESYQRLIDQLSEYVPTMQYTTGPINHDLIGGGVAGTTVGLISDGVGALFGVSNYNVTNFLGDVGREIDRTREVSAILANPGEIEDLLSLDDEEALEVALRGIALEADRNASKSHAAEKGSRLLIPATSDFDTALDQIGDVWLQASEKFPDELPLKPSLADLDTTDPDNARDVANEVRRVFFDLPQNERDRLITEYPQIAVNLVNSWEWTDRADELGHEATTPYRTSGTNEALAQHQYYIKQGFIRPVSPYQRIERIIGLIATSKQQTAQSVYELTAQRINDSLWEQKVPESTKAMLETAVEKWGTPRGVRDAKSLWQRWGTLEGEFEEWFAGEVGIDPENEDAFQQVKDHFKIASDAKAWGTSWPSLDPDEVSQRFGNLKINSFTEEVQRQAEAAGIELRPGMTGLELHDAIREQVTANEGPLVSFVMPGYNTYVQERGAAPTAAINEIRKQAYNPNLPEAWRNDVQKFLNLAEANQTAARERDTGMTRAEVDEVRDLYTSLMLRGEGSELAFNDLWKNAYERSYGPLDWEQPEPPPVFDDDGSLTSHAYTPYVREIVDGDTIVVSEKPGPGAWPVMSRSGQTESKRVRLIGVRARDYGLDDAGATEDKAALTRAIRAGVARGDRIYLVRDPDTVGGNTDMYGRELAWLYIGDEPYFQDDGFLPTD